MTKTIILAEVNFYGSGVRASMRQMERRVRLNFTSPAANWEQSFATMTQAMRAARAAMGRNDEQDRAAAIACFASQAV